MSNFTLPGESGYEDLTLELAQLWGADVIRDSDGTELSSEILDAGYDIYSTVCVIRGHNDWLAEHPEHRQEAILCTKPRLAVEDSLGVRLLDDFFEPQFAVDSREISLDFWEVYDRTSNSKLDRARWSYDPARQSVTIETEAWHEYTVSFFAWREWEEISMYNHLTNGWDKEHLLPLDPYRPEARAYLKDWLHAWCQAHPDTNVVRFTSLFYNFAWIWGSDSEQRHLFTDWASYDFTVSPEALRDFALAKAYDLSLEDFVRQGKYNATHRVPALSKRDWMAFVSDFVLELGKELVDIVHSYGKLAYVFYDDSWVGMEPYNGRFPEYGFDGLIKCVFSAYEVRLLANVDVPVKELRFHPYLFPVGLGGAPTFSEGGDPAKDALMYWKETRRALLRQPVDRTGLGGYLHLVQDYPDFVETMTDILAEFRQLLLLHEAGPPVQHCNKVGIVHSWGKLRTWTLSGHFHETDDHVLIHILESLAGMPFPVEFYSFSELADGIPDDLDILINAGSAGDAWSGGDAWASDQLVANLTRWVYEGGIFVGIDAPSALPGYQHSLRMAHVLGIDINEGDYACHGRRSFSAAKELAVEAVHDVRIISKGTVVEAEAQGLPYITKHRLGEGLGIYLQDFNYSAEATQLLETLLLGDTQSDNPHVELAVFRDSGKVVFVNSSAEEQEATVDVDGKTYKITVPGYRMKLVDL